MKIFLFLILSMIGTVSFAQGHDHTETVCADDRQDVCLHLGIHNAINTSDAAQFMVHFLVASDVANSLKNVKVDLWMDMGEGTGHGSSPVTVTQKAPGKYVVSNAYFVMEGEWLVRVDFDLDGSHHQIIVPVEVK